ncbi:hypothetical protein D3C72_1056460 [compost metagenome]
MVGAGFGLEQFLAADLAFGVELADVRLLIVADAGGHWPARHEHRRQVAERQRAHHQPRHDLVADAQVQRRIEHLVRQRHRRRQRDHVAREQRQVHAVLALRDAVAHRGRAAGELRGAAGFERGLLEPLRESRQRLVRRQHVVVGRDDRQVGPLVGLQPDLRGVRHGSHRMGQVGTGKLRAFDLLPGHGVGAVKVRLARGGAAGDDAGGDPLEHWMTWHGVLLRGSFQPSALCRVPHDPLRSTRRNGYASRSGHAFAKQVLRPAPRQALASHVNWPHRAPSMAGPQIAKGVQGEHA